MKTKAKGSNAERELLHMLWDTGWAVIRAAGSGSIPLPSPDLIAGKAGRTLMIECKVTASSIQYFDIIEIQELEECAKRFGAEPWVAVKFNREGWYFVPTTNLENTPQAKRVAKEHAKIVGFTFEEMTKTVKNTPPEPL